MRKKGILRIVSLVLSLVLLLSLFGCGTKVEAKDLMRSINAPKAQTRDSNDEFLVSQLGFALELLRQNGGGTQNTLISPLSLAQSLGILANGSDGETLEQIRSALGDDIPLEQLNEYYYTYLKGILPTDPLSTVNSIWFREGFEIKEEFLEKNAQYYNADAYSSPFDGQTVEDMNTWVSENTEGVIDRIIDEINGNTRAIMLNATLFNAEWEVEYKENMIFDSKFENLNGESQTATFMGSVKELYFAGDTYEGIIKPYKGGKYSFAALMPKNNLISNRPTLEKLLTQILTEDELKTAMQDIRYTVNAHIPKFSMDFTLDQNEVLKKMGINDAFDPASADLSGISEEPLFVSKVMHKTNITVDEKGTVAAAATRVDTAKIGSSAAPKYVKFNRPFMYMIIETDTLLPIFVGTVTSL